MLKSIQQSKKLFSIEGAAGDGRIDIKTTKYLLSLPKDKQLEALNTLLVNLKNDLAIFEDPMMQASIGEGGYIEKAQLQILIQVVEGLLARI